MGEVLKSDSGCLCGVSLQALLAGECLGQAGREGSGQALGLSQHLLQGWAAHGSNGGSYCLQKALVSRFRALLWAHNSRELVHAGTSTASQ